MSRIDMNHIDLAFRRFYRDNVATVFRAAQLYGSHGAQAEDVVQEVFLIAHRLGPAERTGASARGWLFNITCNVAAHVRRTEHRSSRKRVALSEFTSLCGRAQQPPTGEVLCQISSLLAQISPEQRTVFIGAELLGLSGPELAAAHGQSVNTIYSRLRLARARLQAVANASDVDLASALDDARTSEGPTSSVSSSIWVGVSGSLGVGGKLGAVLGGSAKAAAVVLSLGASAGLLIGTARGPNVRPEARVSQMTAFVSPTRAGTRSDSAHVVVSRSRESAHDSAATAGSTGHGAGYGARAVVIAGGERPVTSTRPAVDGARRPSKPRRSRRASSVSPPAHEANGDPHESTDGSLVPEAQALGTKLSLVPSRPPTHVPAPSSAAMRWGAQIGALEPRELDAQPVQARRGPSVDELGTRGGASPVSVDQLIAHPGRAVVFGVKARRRMRRRGR
ncbi:MAG: hypothetical protein JKY37_10960 [Nannocystaceae bacterium]|nr:hypothetical protein [Nannocystaceae bacterium]